jgi:LPS-assembly protein
MFRSAPAPPIFSRYRFLAAAILATYFLLPSVVTAQLLCPPSPPPTKNGEEVNICAVRQEKDGQIFKLHVRSRISYRDFILWADEATYDSNTGNADVEGHVVLDGGPNDEHIEASKAEYNVRNETGRFYNVVGTIGLQKPLPRHLVLTSTSPFAFTGKLVEKTGPDHYIVHNGTITSCELPHPKWQFNAHRVVMELGHNAVIYRSSFRIRGVPVLFLPIATHPLQRQPRQSGFLIPNLGRSSTKGTIFGDSFYWAINRSMDATLGAQYFSQRGWAQHGEFRARPTDKSYVGLAFFGVADRGIGTPKVSQGGQEVRLNGQARFGDNFRAVANIDYLSSFIFRLAFNEVFTQIVSSEVISNIFLSKPSSGFFYNAAVRRYENFESTNNADRIVIWHAPTLEYSSLDHPVGQSPLVLSFDIAAEGLSRSEPSFRTAPLVGRFDLAPAVSLPLHFRGWSLRPEVGVRSTFYTQRLLPASGSVGVASNDPTNRRAIDASVELRPPSLERVFDHGLFGHKLKHVVEPQVVYRRVAGVNNFPNILRFDERDILSDTNEVEYRVVNRLYSKQSSSTSENCETPREIFSRDVFNSSSADSPALDSSLEQQLDQQKAAQTAPCPAGPTAHELVSWELGQKYFLDTTFGGALVDGRRNVFTTTADLTGIAFLTSPRHLSPLVSRLRIAPNAHMDADWELDYDFKSSRISSSTALVNYQLGRITFGGSDVYLRVPGEILVSNSITSPLHFHQFRLMLAYGTPNKRGLSGAGAVGFDADVGFLQYSAVQSSYNWDCCGVSVEYRRFALGTVRNENQYRFSFNLSNVGSFGNMKRQERLY